MPRKPTPEKARRQAGRPPIYPWATWLDGEQHLIEPRADYDCGDESMRQQIYMRARAENVRVSVRRAHGGFLVQAVRTQRPVGTNRKYDWDKLFDGAVHNLELGRDVHSTLSSFRTYARQQAADRDLRLITRTFGRTLVLQAVSKEDARPAADLEPAAPQQDEFLASIFQDPLSNPRPKL
jgi:hypothetical protein